ncbi:MAG: hypothetical protein M3417_11080 [Actinomycetota bacterium]|nr:hypothetical protein [Actinomycetota bacterium]
MASRHPRIQVARDPDLAAAIERGRSLVGPGAPASQIVRALALRGAAALDEDREAAERARQFLYDVADGRAAFDPAALETVRDRAWA